MDSTELKSVNRQHAAEKPLDYRGSSDDDAIPTTASLSISTDKQDMERMGKSQQFRRNFRLPTNLAFVALAMGTWEVVLSATAGGLMNGGSGGLVWTYVGSFFAFGTIVLSLAEMSSMAPTAGGQYHWASEFAPRSFQKPISYFAGWLSMLSWQCGTASGMYLEGAEIQAVIALLHTDYTAPPYQAYLIMVGVVSIGAFFNIYLAKHLPTIEGVFLVGHIIGFFAIIITLGTLSPTLPASQVFGTFESQSGYSSLGLSILVGQMSAVYGLIGSDGAVHMAEETEEASITVPKSMTYSYIMNGILGFSMLLLYLFCLTDVDGALNSNVGLLGFPYMYMFLTGTGSTGAAAVLGCLVLILGWAGATSFLASTSRQTFAFARDRGLPCSDWLAHVDQKHLVPTRTVLFSWCFTILLCLIKIGSATAFNAIISLQLLALLSTYAISIGCLALKRYHNEPLPRTRWSLGKWGLPVNCAALVYSVFVMIFCCFPSAVPVTTQNFNWAPVMFTGVLAISAAYYLVHGRHTYQGPVVYVAS